jgi:signal transduction histidine kinase/CheY-like chemotaxis protein
MTNNRFIYFTLAVFIAGMLLLVFIQYNSSRSIHQLIEGNSLLLRELKTGNDLREMERDILSVESKIRAAVATGDSVFAEGIDAQIADAEANLDTLRLINIDSESVADIGRLAVLTREKLEKKNLMVDSFFHAGRKPDKSVIANPRARGTANEINTIIRRLYLRRQQRLAGLNAMVQKNGRIAHTSGNILIGFVLLTGSALFWFILNRIRKQNELIRQLDISERKLQEAVKIKENFLANMSHEIRTPLNSIIGFARLLSKKPQDAESAEFVSAIRDSGENLLTIINDILDLSKIEAGMIRVDGRPFAVRELFHSVTTMFYHRVKEKGLDLSVNVAADVPEILLGDATRLTQIVVNLISNAAKFTDTGGISIGVSSDANGGGDGNNDGGAVGGNIRLWVTVTDTGIGIRQEQLAAIFERFSQAESSTTRKYGGTGLGLTIVKELIEIQHGKIEVESEPGKGATFRFFIPYQVVAAERALADVPGDVIAARPRMEGVSILVADDNRMNQRLMEHLLGGAGFSYDIVDDGQKAVDRLREKKYQLVLMDIQMPVMDGYAASRMIREDLRSSVPIIAMTAHAMRGEREKCLESGMNEYLPKPIDADELFRMMAKLLDASGIDRSTVYSREPGPKGDAQPVFSFETIDLAYLRDLSGGDQEYEIEMADQFLHNMPEELGQLRAALATNDLAAVNKVAHNMKTTVSIMGMSERLSGLLDQLEFTDGDTDIMAAFGRLQLLCERAMEEARQFRRSLHL